MGNGNLNRAKNVKNNEFYTRREDIENELPHYAEHFRGKVVYCNCDDPQWSEFWQFFMRNFKPWGLKKLMATHYEPNDKNYAYKLEVCEDTNGDGAVGWRDEPTITQIPCNGDFRSQFCIDMLKEADIVVTNPPFTLIREYIAQLMEYGKKFLIIGPLSAVSGKDIFPLLKEDKIWIGYSHPKVFRVPDTVTGDSVFEENGVKYQKFGNVQWYTNLDIPKRHDFLDLRGNYYRYSEYPHYDNYDGIDVDKINNIPCDFAGNIGISISFMEVYNPEQFEIIGFGKGELARSIGVTKNYRGRSDLAYHVGDKNFCPFGRMIVRLRNPEPRRYPDED